jgi:hypothetical protein
MIKNKDGNINFYYKFYFWIIVAILTSTFPPIFLKFYIDTNNFYWLFASIIILLVGVYSYYILFHYDKVNIIFFITKWVAIFLVIISSIFLHSEKVDNEVMLAFILGFISLYILSKKSILLQK